MRRSSRLENATETKRKTRMSTLLAERSQRLRQERTMAEDGEQEEGEEPEEGEDADGGNDSDFIASEDDDEEEEGEEDEDDDVELVTARPRGAAATAATRRDGGAKRKVIAVYDSSENEDKPTPARKKQTPRDPRQRRPPIQPVIPPPARPKPILKRPKPSDDEVKPDVTAASEGHRRPMKQQQRAGRDASSLSTSSTTSMFPTMTTTGGPTTTYTLTQFFHEILQWNFYDDMIKQVQKDFVVITDANDGSEEGEVEAPTKVPSQFTSYEHYFSVWKPLALEEVRAQTLNAVTTETPSPITVQVSAHGATFLDVTCKVRLDARKRADAPGAMFKQSQRALDSMFVNDLVLITTDSSYFKMLSSGKSKDTETNPPTSSPVGFLAIVSTQRQSREGLTLLMLASDWRQLENVKDDGIFAFKLNNLVTSVREFRALCDCQGYRLMPLLLSGKHHAGSMRLDTLGIEYVRWLNRSFNESQLEAITAAATSHGFTLIKGPPGTGKTTTLKGLLNSIHLREFSRYYNAVLDVARRPDHETNKAWAAIGNEKPHILVTAPSNAAVDNIVGKVMEEGFCDGEGRRYFPKIVRVGRGMSANVRSVGLEEMVDQICHTPAFELEQKHIQIMHKLQQVEHDAGMLRHQFREVVYAIDRDPVGFLAREQQAMALQQQQQQQPHQPAASTAPPPPAAAPAQSSSVSAEPKVEPTEPSSPPPVPPVGSPLPPVLSAPSTSSSSEWSLSPPPPMSPPPPYSVSVSSPPPPYALGSPQSPQFLPAYPSSPPAPDSYSTASGNHGAASLGYDEPEEDEAFPATFGAAPPPTYSTDETSRTYAAFFDDDAESGEEDEPLPNAAGIANVDGSDEDEDDEAFPSMSAGENTNETTKPTEPATDSVVDDGEETEEDVTMVQAQEEDDEETEEEDEPLPTIKQEEAVIMAPPPPHPAPSPTLAPPITAISPPPPPMSPPISSPPPPPPPLSPPPPPPPPPLDSPVGESSMPSLTIAHPTDEDDSDEIPPSPPSSPPPPPATPARIDYERYHAYRFAAQRLNSCLEMLNELRLESQRYHFARQGVHENGKPSQSLRQALEVSFLDTAHIVFTTLSSAGVAALDACTQFDVLVVDEAAQAVELSTIIPMKFGSRQCVLVGDPQQLSATVFSRTSGQSLYERSLFERLEATGHPVHMLRTQYRSHPMISEFPRHYFYGGKLQDGDNVKGTAYAKPYHRLGPAFRPLVFWNLLNSRESTRSVSRYNAGEAELAVNLYLTLKNSCPPDAIAGKVGMITPYSQQMDELRKRFRKALGDRFEQEVEINTVDGFQGREKDIIILSTVRADPKAGVGFLNDIRRMNVSLTRAKYACYVIGNEAALKSSKPWAALLDHSYKTQCMVHVYDPTCNLLTLHPTTEAPKSSKRIGPPNVHIPSPAPSPHSGGGRAPSPFANAPPQRRPSPSGQHPRAPSPNGGAWRGGRGGGGRGRGGRGGGGDGSFRGGRGGRGPGRGGYGGPPMGTLPQGGYPPYEQAPPPPMHAPHPHPPRGYPSQGPPGFHPPPLHHQAAGGLLPPPGPLPQFHPPQPQYPPPGPPMNPPPGYSHADHHPPSMNHPPAGGRGRGRIRDPRLLRQAGGGGATSGPPFTGGAYAQPPPPY